MKLRLVVLSCIVLSLGFADVLNLRDGRVIHGEYLGGDSRHVRMAVADQVVTYDVGDIASVQFGAGSAQISAPVPAPPEAPTVPPETAPPAGVSTTVPVMAASGDMLPAGTSLIVRLIDPVDSQVNKLGDTFKASIDEPVVVDGRTLIPRGADVIAKLVQAQQSGKITGRTELTLDLMSVKVNGRMVDVTTQDVTTASKSRGTRSGAVIGGGAALGAIIGAIAGGGKGAAVGTVAGAGAGTGAQVLTKGQTVKIPAETRLEFILQQAVAI
jgi:hypothetical protein